MTVSQEILRALGRIEGELIELRQLSKRLRRVEWAFLVAAFAYLCK